MHLSPESDSGPSKNSFGGMNNGNGSGGPNSGQGGTGGQRLLFFDTFSHDVEAVGGQRPAEINLDLVQFPSPVVVEEVRVIPLGARYVHL
jgi:hypothetical protein